MYNIGIALVGFGESGCDIVSKIYVEEYAALKKYLLYDCNVNKIDNLFLSYSMLKTDYHLNIIITTGKEYNEYFEKISLKNTDKNDLILLIHISSNQHLDVVKFVLKEENYSDILRIILLITKIIYDGGTSSYDPLDFINISLNSTCGLIYILEYNQNLTIKKNLELMRIDTNKIKVIRGIYIYLTYNTIQEYNILEQFISYILEMFNSDLPVILMSEFNDTEKKSLPDISLMIMGS